MLFRSCVRNVYALSIALESENADILSAADGKESLEILKLHQDTHLVLMDIMMPEMDGYIAAEKIRETGTEIPIIALTASATMNNQDRAFSVGMNDYVTKPFNPKELYHKIAKYSGRI